MGMVLIRGMDDEVSGNSPVFRLSLNGQDEMRINVLLLRDRVQHYTEHRNAVRIAVVEQLVQCFQYVLRPEVGSFQCVLTTRAPLYGVAARPFLVGAHIVQHRP